MVVNLNEKSRKFISDFIFSTVIPRPIAWIVTESKHKKINIAPFSFFTGVSSEPPVLMVSIGHKKDFIPKDTLRNIRETKKATICSVSPEHFAKMKETSLSLEFDRSEADEFDIKTTKVNQKYPPIINGVQSAFFVDFIQEVELFNSSTIPVFLEIKEVFYDEKNYNKETEKINIDVIGRIGKSYSRIHPME
jgi:flavin reductase (DIM6/NTAB) family NADH-FMN oxidoreductase RutF